MPQELNELIIGEVSLVDHPACSSPDETGRKVPRARVALYKRDESEREDNTDNLSKSDIEDLEKAVHGGKTQSGTKFPKSDFAYTPDDESSHWKLRLTKTPGGNPDAGIVGAAVAALGKGFRGNKVIIPSSDLDRVKARVKAAWKQANPDKSIEDLPDILKGDTSMTLQELEARVLKQDGILAGLVNENKVLKTEREVVLKMSKKERKAYATMNPDKQKEFMGGDETKRKSMCDAAMKEMKEKAAEDSMDEALKAEFAKAGPAEKAIMIGKQLEKLAKAADAEGGSNEDEMDKKKKEMMDKRKAKAKAKPEDDDDDEEEDEDEEDDKDDLQLRKQLARTQDRVVKAEATLDEIKKRERLQHFTSIAERLLPNTSGDPITKGADLMSIAELSGGENTELFKRYLGNLEIADKSMLVHYGEVGKAGAGVIPAEKVLMAKVEEVAKRDNITSAKAMDKVMADHPELYMAYEQDHRRAIGARN